MNERIQTKTPVRRMGIDRMRELSIPEYYWSRNHEDYPGPNWAELESFVEERRYAANGLVIVDPDTDGSESDAGTLLATVVLRYIVMLESTDGWFTDPGELIHLVRERSPDFRRALDCGALVVDRCDDIFARQQGIDAMLDILARRSSRRMTTVLVSRGALLVREEGRSYSESQILRIAANFERFTCLRAKVGEEEKVESD